MSGLPRAWTMATLDDLKSSEPRSITDGPFGSNLTRAHYTDEGPRVVRLQNIGHGRFIDAAAHIKPDHFDTLRQHEVQPGDLLLASLGEVLPRACIAPSWLGPAIVKADCIRVRLSSSVDPRWVLYALQRPDLRRWADARRHGVGRPRLGLKTIREIPIPVPPIEEQRRIVAILEDHLSRLDAAVDTLSVSTKRLGAMGRAVLDSVIWQRGRSSVALQQLLDRIEAGKSLGARARPAERDEWGIIKVSAMTWGEFRPHENKVIDSGQADPRFEVRPGDLLLSRANTSDYVGASVHVGPVRPRLLLSDKSLRLVPMPGVNARWLHLALSSPRARTQISARATGTKDSMRNIAQRSLGEVMLPQVTAAEQESDLVRFDRMDSATATLGSAVERSRQRHRGLRRALIEAAFSGRLTGHASDLDQVEEMAEA